ncbi:hypothetical protein [Cohaesibacter haloalkalitolerans]|uniref:hypothetical protein n=1 Tax=Cohaesibacter haloalkalitolerans TaxID=1162980 RepID=UPI000E64B5EB|nr:hypothetical protein [Cohaesibacter haloalkalitolerans]
MSITIDLGQLITPEAKQAFSLERAKSIALDVINTRIEKKRAALLTDMVGQEMIYLAKEAEAKAWQAATNPDLADYPLLAAEVGITADDADALAALWLSMADQWRQTAAILEAIRLKAKADIGAAETLDAVTSVEDGIVWP